MRKSVIAAIAAATIASAMVAASGGASVGATPTIASVVPNEAPLGRAVAFTLSGTSLSLITSVTCGGRNGAVHAASASSAQISCPPMSVAGPLHVIVMQGKTSSTATSFDVVTYRSEKPLDAGWGLLATGPFGVVAERKVTSVDGVQVILNRFPAETTMCHYHVGSAEPPGVMGRVPTASRNALVLAEQKRLVAAFDAGFKMKDAPGGIEAAGRIFAGLVPGDASFIIEKNGSCHVGIWGVSDPTPNEAITDVRQNLRPLIASGAVKANTASWQLWGATLNNVATTTRTGAGTDGHGDLIVASCIHCLPRHLAIGMLAGHVVTAMQLDINPFPSIIAIVGGHSGGPLQVALPGEQQSPSVYLNGWSRDFFALTAN